MKKKTYIKTCEFCGSTFETKYPLKRYCTKACELGSKTNYYFNNAGIMRGLELLMKRTCKTCKHNVMGVCKNKNKEIGMSYVMGRMQKAPNWCPCKEVK